VRRGLDVARAEMRDFVRGLHDGDGGPPTQGGVFDIGIGQGGSGPGAADLPTYKAQLEAWLQDGAFWSDMSRYVSDWSQELYGDPLNYAVSGAPLAARRDFLNDYFQHQLVGARLGGDATAAARSFLEDAYSPLANAAWQWDSGFPSTVIPFEQMQDYVSAQIYALRHFSASDGQARDHWGFAWAPHNASGMPPADFTAETGALLDRLAAAIHDSAEPLDPSDPGVGACGPPGENLWCSLGLPSAWFNDGWKTFTYWGRLTLAFATPAQDLTAGNASAPIAIQTRLRGSAYDTPNALVVRLDSSSAQGAFSTSASGPWASTIDVTIPAGGDTAPSVYYRDTTAGSPVLTASAAGTDSGEQTETVDPGAVAPPPPPAPPPTPPPPPPVLPPNQQPTITSTRFGELRHVLRGRPYVIESVRFRVCDDSNGRLLARVQQTLRRENRLLTKSIVARSLTGPGGGCRAYLISWQLRGAFLARGTYTVSLRVRDSQGAWSKPVQRSRHRAGSR
jgi:hypothetical protein